MISLTDRGRNRRAQSRYEVIDNEARAEIDSVMSAAEEEIHAERVLRTKYLRGQLSADQIKELDLRIAIELSCYEGLDDDHDAIDRGLGRHPLSGPPDESCYDPDDGYYLTDPIPQVPDESLCGSADDDDLALFQSGFFDRPRN